MKSITKRLFLYAFLLALISAGAIYIYLKSINKEQTTTIEMTDILVAKVDIPTRTIISKDMLTEVEIPKGADIGDFINNSQEIIGKYTKEKVYKDERFKQDKLIESPQEELSLVLKPEQRAVTVMVNLDSGVADLIKPGDFVDVLVYLPELKEAERIVRPDVAKMILQNIEALAIDQNLYRDSEPQLEEIPSIYYVTLSVSVKKVEELVLAQNIGNIKLALRPLNDNYVYNTDGVIWEELLLNDSNQIKDMQPQYEIQSDAKGQSGDTYDKYYYYTIQYGDTLKSISQKFYGDESKYIIIKEVNKIEDENTIVTGTGLKVPVLPEEGDQIGENSNLNSR